jgi:hypothetical protein
MSAALRNAAQQALKAMESYQNMMLVEAGCRFKEGEAAITALRAALAQEEQEPVAWAYEIATTVRDGKGARWESRITEYEPKVPIGMIRNLTLLYTHQPGREWRGLTEKEIQSIHDTYHKRMGPQEFARSIEQALKEKNA